MSRVNTLSVLPQDLSSRMAWQVQAETDKLWREMASRPTELPRILREFRTKSGLTQEAAGEALGLRLRDFQRYEAGHNLPRRQTVERIAKTLKLPSRAFYPTRDLPPDELGQYVSEQEDALEAMRAQLNRIEDALTELAQDGALARVERRTKAQAGEARKKLRNPRGKRGSGGAASG